MDHLAKMRFNRLFLGILVIAVLMLGASFGVEFFGAKACFLCKIQRIPYALMGINALLGITMELKRGVIRVIQICLLGGVLLGGFHLAVQLGMTGLPCSREQKIESIDVYRERLQKGGCNQIGWKILGVPASAWSGVICLGGLFLLLKTGRSRRTGQA